MTLKLGLTIARFRRPSLGPVPSPFDNAQIGDAIEGGIYAGTLLYGDGREFHIVFALQSGEIVSTNGNSRWKVEQTSTADTASEDDGLANTSAMEAAGLADHPAAAYCLGYSIDGYDDWYLPAPSELALVDPLVDASHAEFSTDLETYRWASKQIAAYPGSARFRRFSDGSDDSQYGYPKDNNGGTQSMRVRPVRRVPV